MAVYRTVTAQATVSDNILNAAGSISNNINPISITSVSWENDCCTITLSDGSSYTSESLKGATGAAGSDGVGIESITWNDYQMTVNLTNGNY